MRRETHSTSSSRSGMAAIRNDSLPLTVARSRHIPGQERNSEMRKIDRLWANAECSEAQDGSRRILQLRRAQRCRIVYWSKRRTLISEEFIDRCLISYKTKLRQIYTPSESFTEKHFNRRRINTEPKSTSLPSLRSFPLHCSRFLQVRTALFTPMFTESLWRHDPWPW